MASVFLRQNRLLQLKAALVLLGLSTLTPTFSAGHLEDRIVAVVNSDLIMLSDVRREVGPEQSRISRQHRGDELAQRLKMAEYMALTKMIERRLQLQEAKARKVEVSDQEVKQAVEQMKRQGETIDLSNPLQTRNVRDQLTLLKVVDREVRSS
ncbi:MAG: SurA N-terminal domain-containing protein, partial [Nitrospirae bacterium]|nr:SurA N-terminal domain-containing protein [Nitrospirota bacterium]